jgi:hypothetical protein
VVRLQPRESGVDHGDFRFELSDQHTEIKARLSLQKDCQFSPVSPDIFERWLSFS